jgi:murein DD-endopeptidase MepM/ murein hydrolase activator NlpD
MSHSRQIRTAFAAAVTALLVILPATGANAATVKVVHGNTLSGIARSLCGSAAAWPGIWHENPQIKDPNLIYPGQRLTVSCRSQGATASRSTTRTVVLNGWTHPLPGHKCTSGWGAPRVGHKHKGNDLPAPFGTPIRAAHAGKVVRISYDAGGAGWYVVLAHPSGVWTLYEHMRSQTFLRVGANVAAGATIGYVGATGNATRNGHSFPHLHFEVHLGSLWGANAAVDPGPFMRRVGVPLGC